MDILKTVMPAHIALRVFKGIIKEICPSLLIL